VEQGIAAREAEEAPAGVRHPVAPLAPVPSPPHRPVARRNLILARVSLAAALTPVVVAAVRALLGGWIPVGESALVAVRARDVLAGSSGGGVPLVGPWADTSAQLGVDVYHPGPLLYDVLAVPVRVAGAQGLVVATALINALAIAGIFTVTRRVAGSTMAALAMALVTVLCWVTGTATLVEPGYPGTVVLPFLLFLVLTWAVLCGETWCLPVAVAVGALVAGTDLRVAMFVPVLLAAGAVSVARDAWGLPVRDWRRPAAVLAVSGVVAVGCLAQPVAAELSGDGGGNLVHLWEGAAEHTSTLDLDGSLRALARVVALPPWWVRPWHADDLGVGPGGPPGPPLLLAVVALAGIGFQAGLRLRDARRRDDQITASGLAVALVASAVALLTLVLLPTTRFGTAVPQLRWLWGVGVFVSLVLFVSGIQDLPTPRGGRWWPASLAAGACILMALVMLPANDRGAVATTATHEAAADITSEVARADLRGPLRVECDEHLLDPYCEAVMAELSLEGVPFVVDAPARAAALGDGRLAGRDEDVTGTLTVAAGDATRPVPRGARRLADHRALSADEAAELEDLRRALAVAIAVGDVKLNDHGEDLAREGTLTSVDPAGSTLHIDPEAALAVRAEMFGAHRRDLVAMIDHDLVDAPAPWRGALDRYRELQDRWDATTVTVYQEP
jgi:hypothetical protein